MDKKMELFNKSMEAATSFEEQDAVSLKFEKEIQAAFEQDEKVLQEEFEKENEFLLSEKQADMQSILDLEKQAEDKVKYYFVKKDIFILTEKEFIKKYKKKDTISLAEYLGLDVSDLKKEVDIVALIYKSMSV